MLLKNMTPYITTQVSAHHAKRKIAEASKIPIEFLAKCDELKAKNVTSTDEVGAELYTEMLLKNMTPYITTQVSAHHAKRKIAEASKIPIEFLAKCDELKAKNVRDLDCLVFLLSNLSEETKLKQFLRNNAKERTDGAGLTLTSHSKTISQLPAPGTKMTQQELSEEQSQVEAEQPPTYRKFPVIYP